MKFSKAIPAIALAVAHSVEASPVLPFPTSPNPGSEHSFNMNSPRAVESVDSHSTNLFPASSIAPSTSLHMHKQSNKPIYKRSYDSSKTSVDSQPHAKHPSEYLTEHSPHPKSLHRDEPSNHKYPSHEAQAYTASPSQNHLKRLKYPFSHHDSGSESMVDITTQQIVPSHHPHSPPPGGRDISKTASSPIRLSTSPDSDDGAITDGHGFISKQHRRGDPKEKTPTAKSHPTGHPGAGGVGSEDVSDDGWRDATMTWYDGTMLQDPACYNGASTSKSHSAPSYQPSDSSLIAAVVRDYHYASCYDFIELARFPLNPEPHSGPEASVIVQVVDECAEGCWNGKNGTWFDLSKGAFSRLYPEDIGLANVRWRHVEKEAIAREDLDQYPQWPNF